MNRKTLFRVALLASGAYSAPALSQAAYTTAPPLHYALDANNIDRSTGAIVFKATELSIGTPGSGGLAFVNYHNGNPGAGGPSGTNWDLVLYTGGGSFRAATGDGTSEYFTQSGSTFVSQSGDGSSLSQSGSTYTLTTRDGSTILYNYTTQETGESGVVRATQVTRPSGEIDTLTWNTTSYYNSGGAPNAQTSQSTAAQTTSASSSKTTASPQALGGGGHTYTWVRLQSVQNNFGYQLHFNYVDSNSDNISSTRQGSNWATLSSVNAINLSVDYCDPTADQCTGLTQTPATVSYSGNLNNLQVTDPLGRVTTYLAQIGSFAVQRPSSSSSNYSYTLDSNARPTQLVRDGMTYTYSMSLSGTTLSVSETDPLSHQSSTTANNSLGELLTSTDALGHTTSFAYNPTGQVTQVTAPEGGYTQYGYDSRGNLQLTTYVPKSGSGLGNITTSAVYPSSCANALTCNEPTSTTDARGAVTNYTYDPNSGRVATVTSPAVNGVSPQTRYTYSALQAYYKNSSGSIVASGSPIYELTTTSVCRTTSSCSGQADETRTTITYGSTGVANNLLPTSTSTGAGNGSLTATASMSYDTAGNPYTSTDGLGNVTRYRYDTDRELVGVVGADPDGGGPLKNRAVRTSYTADGLVSEVDQGTVPSQSDADWSNFSNLQYTTVVYDSADRRNAIGAFAANGVAFSTTQYSYDAAGRLDCTAVRMNAAAFASLPAACSASSQGSYGPDRISRNGYDAAGQLVSVIDGYGTSLQRTTVAYTYTPDGKVQTLTDAKGNLTAYNYDGFDRLLQTAYPLPNSPGNASTTDYEQLGYDANGNITSRRLRDGNNVGFSYDALNRLTQRTSPHISAGDPTTTYSYDLVGHLTGANDENNHALAFTYDALGHKTSEGNAFATVLFASDVAGRRTTTRWGDGFYVTYAYDNANEMTAINENGSSTLVSFAYDDLGRRTSRSFANGSSVNYSYDPVSELTQLALNGGGYFPDTITLGSYSPAGEIGTRSHSNDYFSYNQSTNANAAFTTNGLNQYTAIGGVAQGYDGRGNLTTSGSTSYTYNSRNQMVGGSNLGSTGLYYDPIGRLDTIGPESLHLYYDDDKLITELGSGNAIARRYVFGPGTDEPLVWYEGSGTSDRRFMDADERGSIIRVTDNSNTTKYINSYDEFGMPQANPVGRFLYTGQAWLPSVGMYYYKARMYSPSLGRFMQTDPIGYGDGPNWYNYVGGNPINKIDPSGLNPRVACVNGFCKVEDDGANATGDAGFNSSGTPNGSATDNDQSSPSVSPALQSANSDPNVILVVANPTPKFVVPTNPPQLPPTDLPPGFSVRVMPATEQYPNGYFRIYNGNGQPVDPSTMKPPSNVTSAQARAQTHVDLPAPPQSFGPSGVPRGLGAFGVILWGLGIINPAPLY